MQYYEKCKHKGLRGISVVLHQGVASGCCIRGVASGCCIRGVASGVLHQGCCIRVLHQGVALGCCIRGCCWRCCHAAEVAVACP